MFILYLYFYNCKALRDQSVFITWCGPEEFRGGSREIGLTKGGFTHLRILLRGVQKIHAIQLNLQYLFLMLVKMILQKYDCIATKIQKY